jgi:hypothetical protein
MLPPLANSSHRNITDAHRSGGGREGRRGDDEQISGTQVWRTNTLHVALTSMSYYLLRVRPDGWYAAGMPEEYRFGGADLAAADHFQHSPRGARGIDRIQ